MKTRNCIAALLLAGLCLGACARKAADEYRVYYPACRQPLLDMESVGSVGESAGKGLFGGALLGSATGFFVGLLLNGGNLADAGISAAVGATTGGITGGVSGAVQGGASEERKNRLLAAYYEQLDGDINDLTLPQAAGAVAMQCYRRNLAERLEKSGGLSPAQAAPRRQEIEQGMRQASILMETDEDAAHAASPAQTGAATRP